MFDDSKPHIEIEMHLEASTRIFIIAMQPSESNSHAHSSIPTMVLCEKLQKSEMIIAKMLTFSKFLSIPDHQHFNSAVNEE